MGQAGGRQRQTSGWEWQLKCGKMERCHGGIDGPIGDKLESREEFRKRFNPNNNSSERPASSEQAKQSGTWLMKVEK